MPWLMAKLYDRIMAASEEACLRDWRGTLLRDLRGEILDVGAGTGANVPFYGDGVTRLVLAEPDPHMRERLREKVAGTKDREVEVVDAPLESLPFPDGSFDAVVSTLVLCSVTDPGQALAEIRRVLRPGGTFAFLEHVAAEDRPKRLKWQRRVEPVWKWIAGNCHLTRRTEEAIRSAGFEVAGEVEHESIRKAMPLARPSVRGHAVRTG